MAVAVSPVLHRIASHHMSGAVSTLAGGFSGWEAAGALGGLLGGLGVIVTVWLTLAASRTTNRAAIAKTAQDLAIANLRIEQLSEDLTEARKQSDKWEQLYREERRDH